MARRLIIHPRNPQPRRVAEAAAIHAGGLIAYPTDSSYTLGCHLGDKRAMDRIRRIRRTDKHHNFTLVCSDLSEISLYTRIDEDIAYKGPLCQERNRRIELKPTETGPTTADRGRYPAEPARPLVVQAR